MVINIYEYVWEIKRVPPNSEKLGYNTDGITLYNERVILIADNIFRDTLFTVLVHEITHAYLCCQGRWSQSKFTQEELCEFVGFCGNAILEKANQVMTRIMNGEL